MPGLEAGGDKGLGGGRLLCPAGIERIKWEDIKDKDEGDLKC